MLVGALLDLHRRRALRLAARPSARAASSAGRPPVWVASPGGLARDNAQRNPQRTASTAAALMIGLALVDARRSPRRRHHQAVPGCRRPAVHRGLRDHGAEQLRPDSAERGAAPPPRRPASRRSRASAAATASSCSRRERQHDPGDRRRAGDQQGDLARLAGRHAGDDRQPRRRRRRRRARRTRRITTSTSARRSRVISPTGDVLRSEAKGIFAPPTGGSPFGTVTISSCDLRRNTGSSRSTSSRS